MEDVSKWTIFLLGSILVYCDSWDYFEGGIEEKIVADSKKKEHGCEITRIHVFSCQFEK